MRIPIVGTTAAVVAVVVAACGDEGPPPPPVIDGAWHGTVTLHGEMHSIEIELMTTHVVEEQGAFGPSRVAYLSGSATVEVGDSTSTYVVTGRQGILLTLEIGSRYFVSATVSRGPLIDGTLYDHQPPDHDRADRSGVSLRLRRTEASRAP